MPEPDKLTCPECRGTGRKEPRNEWGHLQSGTTAGPPPCPICKGKGYVEP